jgi:hypothetical protein
VIQGVTCCLFKMSHFGTHPRLAHLDILEWGQMWVFVQSAEVMPICSESEIQKAETSPHVCGVGLIQQLSDTQHSGPYRDFPNHNQP